MPALDWILALSYDSGPTEFECSLPQRAWGHERSWEGGSLEVASGSIEAYVIRTDKAIWITARIPEAQLGDFHAALDYALANPGTTTLYPNGLADPGHLAYVLSPKLGEKFTPTRGEDPATFEARLLVRRVDGQEWDLDYYAGP